MSGVVYHYTDTARLPWILRAGELKPGSNKIAGFPDPDFLWATVSPVGDLTASASISALREGRVRLVRFVLPEVAFVRWPDATAMHPAWTADQISRLERLASGKSRPSDWRCRAGMLRRDQWLGIETRTYTDKIWRPLAEGDRQTFDLEPGVAEAIAIGNVVYISERCTGPHGQDAYQVYLAQRNAA